MRILTIIAVMGLAMVVTVCAQPLRLPDPPTPEQAYVELLSVPKFAFGGVGYAGATSKGERAYHIIATSTNALALYSAVLTNGNAQAKLYALCGIRQLAPSTFDTQAKALLKENPRVVTMQGCFISDMSAADVIARIKRGSYDFYFKAEKQ